jgi:hypothetical protein
LSEEYFLTKRASNGIPKVPRAFPNLKITNKNNLKAEEFNRTRGAEDQRNFLFTEAGTSSLAFIKPRKNLNLSSLVSK